MDRSEFNKNPCHPLAKGDYDDVLVPQSLIEHIKVNNIILQMKQGVKTKRHDPKHCTNCQFQEGEIREKEFLRNLKNKLDEELVSKKIENHMLKHNTVTLVGEIAAGLPKLSENPEVIWKKLLKNLPIN